MDERERLDPDLIRARIRDAIQGLEPDTQLDALQAVQRGEVDFSIGPTDREIWVQIGDLTVILDMDDCVPPDGSEDPGVG